MCIAVASLPTRHSIWPLSLSKDLPQRTFHLLCSPRPPSGMPRSGRSCSRPQGQWHHSHDVEASHVTREGQERHYGFHLDRLGICPIKDRPNTFYKERTVTKNTEVQKLQSKIAVQRNEIARLTQLVQKLMEQRDQLTKDLKWMRGEK